MNHLSYPLLALVLLVTGCATHTSSIPKPGSGILEYREITQQAYRAVADVVDSLETLPQGDRHLARFDRALEELELTSVKARARAEAIIARGQNYFDEWKEQLPVATNRPAATAESERYDRLFDHFTRIRERSGEVRQEFRPFMASLRQFRARLDQRSNATPRELSRADVDVLAASGRRVLKALESVSDALNHAETELHALQTAKAERKQ